ncbi:beta-N-acetylhexosaminidase [Amycolatopsis sp. NPDC004368]
MPGFETLLPRLVSVTAAPGVCPWPAPVTVLSAPDLPAEGYRLTITPRGVTLAVADAAGEVYGRETVRQLAGPDAFRAASIRSGLTLPCGVVEDHPRFGWRGCLLDVARHFRTKAEVLRFVDQLAAHKLNVLNLHLTDDQGWRIEVPRFPRLTSVGGWRRSSMVGRHDGPERDDRPHGGFYTTDDLREIVAYAASRAVTVVPEIDVPGHARAAIAAYPELGPDPTARWEVWTSWGISTSLLAPSPSTSDFFRAVFDHVLDVFPSPVIGLGGDEVPGATEAHGGFVRDLAAHLVSRGRRPLGWDEVLEVPGLPPMVIGAWQSEARGALAASAGHDVVLCPEERVYLDHRQSDHPDEPIPVGYLHTLQDVYGYEPALAGPHLLGVQAQVWSEHLDTARRVDYAAFPRLSAFAEVAWSPGRLDFAEFLARLRDHHLPRLDALGVEYRPLEGPHPWQTRPGVPGRPR